MRRSKADSYSPHLAYFAYPSRLLTVPFTALVAAQSSFELGTVYECPAGMSFKVNSCAGNGASDPCDVQAYANGQPAQRGNSTRSEILALLPQCRKPGIAGPAQTGLGGFKVGDTVQVGTAFGWANAQVLRINGNSYYVRVSTGVELWKTYPAELRRIGPITAEDRANGLYALHDRVEVQIDGKWVSGEILQELNMEYEIQLPGNRGVWSRADKLRLVATAEEVASKNAKAGTPPKPEFTSCAGKIEGRYSSSGAGPLLSITFERGKALVNNPFGGDEEFECWTAGDKIILHLPGESNQMDMPIDINKDGSLDTPIGEIRKKS